ncbi:hypothetical protein [Paenibacillus donghaensis]|uniref:Carboxypeptidase regulatory-like domain-containing protein n=1 Tax=Paenibacillus donghaensis TaxID=414771 RepID=A0A2Z2K9L1_9BACL|nr:hypothetical protein [Paenibacillus donghaensis]ASA19433.1 hypothetical protein B9T62_00330 [Paenibacillus donghaensis]
MRIKLKVKHLVLFGCVPVMLLIVLLSALPSLTNRGEPAPAAPPEVTRADFLRKLEASTGSKRIELIRKNIVLPGTSDYSIGFDVYIGSSMSHWSHNESDPLPLELPTEQEAALLEEYVDQGQADDSMLQAVRQLAYAYDALGRRELADEALVRAADRISSSSYISEQIRLTRAERTLKRQDWAEAEVLLKAQDTTGGVAYDGQTDGQRSWLQAQLLFATGRSGQALEELNRALTAYREHGKPQPEGETSGITDTEMKLTALSKAMKTAVSMGYTAPAAVQGTLKRSDGTPVAHAGVFLRAESELNHNLTSAEPYQTVTDAEGRFRFNGVIPGFYQLQLGLSFEQIDGWTWPVQADNDWLELKPGDEAAEELTLQPLLELQAPVNQVRLDGPSVDFGWEAVEGAAYYTLNGTYFSGDSSFSSPIRERIPGNQASIPVEEIYYNTNGFSYSSGDNTWDTLEPASILAYTNPDSRLSWSIDAFDKKGRLLTSSKGYRLNEATVGNLPFFYLQNRQLTPADRLLLDHKLEEALEAYRQAYAADPQDLHALHMLVHLMIAKASMTGDSALEEETIPLLEKLATLYPSSNYVSTLADYYSRKGDWKPYNRYYALLQQLKPHELNPYEKSIHAQALLRQGQLEEARKLLATALQEDGSHRYVGSYLAAELYAGEPLSDVIQLAERYPEHSYGHTGYRWTLLLKQLDAERGAGQQPAYDKQWMEKLGWYIHGQNEPLEKWLEGSSESPALKALMTALQEIRWAAKR